MALSYAHGALTWLAADAVATNYTVSGLAFQPKGMRFTCVGISSAVDATSAITLRVSVGFATSTSDRRCVGEFSEHAVANSNCDTTANNDCVLATSDGAGARNGLLDIDQVNSDGFRLVVDDQGVVDLTVFWEAWGGSDITVAACFDLAEPAAIGDVDVTVTGFTAAGTDQVVLFAGCQDSNALNTGLAEAAGLFVGAAKNSSNQWIVGGNSDDASATSDTDGWQLAGECIGMIIRAGAATVEARASFTQYNANGFRVNYAARAVTGRKTVGLAMKGGSWAVGNVTITNTAGQTATVSGLSFAPVGLHLAARFSAVDASNVAKAGNGIVYGCGTSTSSRRSIAFVDFDAQATMSCETSVDYNSILSERGGDTKNLDAMNSDGFRLIVDVGTSATSHWNGYVTFGDGLFIAGILQGVNSPMIGRQYV